MSENEKVSVFEERLNPHPVLKDRFQSLPDIAEDTAGNYDRAGEAELKITEELRRTGNILVNERAERKESAEAGELRKSCRNMTGHGKKTLPAYGIRRNNCFRERISGKRSSCPSVFRMLRSKVRRVSTSPAEEDRGFRSRCSFRKSI